MKEQRWANPAEFVEPDDEVLKGESAVKHLIDFLNSYKEKPRFLEQTDQTSKALKAARAKKIPLPTYAKMQMAMMKKIAKERKMKQLAEE